MTDLPRISGRECVAALEKAGFRRKRQRGSHVVLRRDEPFAQLVVPDHEELDRGTLRAIIRHAGLSPDEFAALLRQARRGGDRSWLVRRGGKGIRDSVAALARFLVNDAETRFSAQIVRVSGGRLTG